MRFIDNLSTGRRGALLVEELLAASRDSLVVMLARRRSLLPFAWRFDDMPYRERCLSLAASASSGGGGDGAPSEQLEKLLDRLLMVQYEELDE